MYATHPHQVISEEQFRQLLEDGYLILPRYIRGEELKELQAAQRRVLKTWDQVKENPPKNFSEMVPYPYPDPRMSRLYLHPELIKFGKRFLKSEQVFARVGYMLTRYPGFPSGDKGHIDNGNNSLLPMSDTLREHGQIGFWIHLEEVRPGQAPLLLGKKQNGQDTSKCEPLICPEGTIAIFNNYTWHASSPFTAKEGQRFVWGFALGRADHYFEGLIHYTQLGHDKTFQAVVGSMTPEERELFRFPPPNHRYYTQQTLALLEKQYPGWNASGAYKPID
jgi:hypothetical protein